jgi:proline iminopeptidase
LVKDWSVMDRLSEIHVPTLVMAGRDDFLFPPEHQVELAASLPNARFQLFEGSGHVYFLEQFELVNQSVIEFLQSL